MSNRIIIKPSLFSNENYIKLTKEQSDTLFKIMFLFADSYEDKLHYEFIEKHLGFSVDYAIFETIFEYEEEYILIGNYFKYFKTKIYTAKSRLKSKGKLLKEMVEEHVENLNNLIKEEDELEQDKKQEVEDKKTNQTYDYDKIQELWNENFKDTAVSQIKILDDKRKRTIRNFFNNGKKLINKPEIDFEVFFASYFKRCSSLNMCKNGNQKTGWKPDFDYLLKTDVMIKIREKTFT